MSCKNLIFTVLTLAVAQTAPCSALFLLDNVMDLETQKKTGVINLTTNQKIALEAWLNQNFEFKQTQQEAEEPQLFLSINIDAGRILQLSNGSLWEVAPTDVAQASVWITPFPIKITQSSDLDYPYLLVNKISGISIKARPTNSRGTPPSQSGQPAPSTGQTPPQSNQASPPTGTPPSQSGQPAPSTEQIPSQNIPGPSLTGTAPPAQANPRSKISPPAQSGY